MSTTTIEARCNARPTRLAFILSTPDRAQLLNVITRATTLWGGRFNPIVILDDTGRRAVGRHYELAPRDPYTARQADLLKAFDPDLLISYTDEPLPAELSPWSHRIFPAAALDWDPVGNNNVRSYFVDIKPILDDLWDKEFRNVATPRFKLRFMEKAEAEGSLLRAMRFGIYPTDDHYEFVRRNFVAEAVTDNAELRARNWPGDFQTPLSLTNSYCNAPRQRQSHAFFVLDPEDPFDMVDYWNLRASGMILFALTMQDYRDYRVPIEDFCAAANYPNNPAHFDFLTVIKGASITDAQVEEVRRWITEENLTRSRIGIMGWVPEYHRGNYGAADELEIEHLRCFESNAQGILIDGSGRIDGPKPSFLGQRDHFSHWSMDLDLQTYRDPKACYRLPWLNSGCDALVSRHVGFGSRMDAGRVSLNGIVTRHDGDSSHVRISPINAIQVVGSFLEGVGMKYLETSSPGLALVRIIDMMETLHACEIFQNSAIRDTLDEMGRGELRSVKHVNLAAMKALKDFKLYGKPATQPQKGEHVDRLLKRAVDSKVFRVGLKFKCTACQRERWYATTEFAEEYNCKSCFSRERTPHIHEHEWYFSSDGLFRSSNKLDGNITILLALAFFQEISHFYNMQYAPSFTYTLNKEQKEMDFAIIASEMMRSGVDMIFGEAKSGSELDTAERAKLKAFGLQTKAYICFCTLAPDFTDEDKDYFKDLYTSGVKIILLQKFLLEMDSFELSDFKSKNNPGRSATEADWLMRLTVIRTLGEEFAKANYLWL